MNKRPGKNRRNGGRGEGHNKNHSPHTNGSRNQPSEFGFNSSQKTYSEVSAPYNFAPISRFVFLPEWGRAVSHDLPFEDGFSGRLDFELTTHTPLCVGLEREKDREGFSSAPFAYLEDGKGGKRYIIPGSTLKGMVRNVLEIASFGKLSLVDDQRLAARDLTTSGAFYTRQVTELDKNTVLAKVHAGFLYRDRDEAGKSVYRVHPTRYSRIDDRNLPQVAIRDRRTGKPRNVAISTRHQSIKSDVLLCAYDQPVAKLVKPGPKSNRKVDLFHFETNGIWSREKAQKGDQKGFLVLTPKVGRKHRQFLFDEPKTDDVPVSVSGHAWAAFLAAHPEKEKNKEQPWGIWKKRLDTREVGPKSDFEPGVPVFYLADAAGNVVRLGLAQMPKLGYDYTIGDMIAHASKDHQSAEYDLAEAIFGTVRQEEVLRVKNLKGRVSFGTAHCQAGARPSKTKEMVLNGPKPTYYPAYVEQDQVPTSSVDFATYFAPNDPERPLPEIRGWKRYWVRKQLAGTASPNNSTDLSTRLEVMPAGTRFTFSVLVHNLRMVELGALAWSLGFGETLDRDTTEAEHYHSLGMGKPFGFGAVSLRLLGGALTPNSLVEDKPGNVEGIGLVQTLSDAKSAFENLMNEAYGKAVAQTGKEELNGWARSEQLVALCNLASARRANEHEPRRPPASSCYEAPYMAFDTKRGVGFNHYLNAKKRTGKFSVLDRAGAHAPLQERMVFERERMVESDGGGMNATTPKWLRDAFDVHRSK